MTDYPTRKDPGTAMIIEILAGLFGFLGIGYIYAGQTGAGIVRLIGWWIILLIGFFLSTITLGLGLFCMVPLVFIGPIISRLMLNGSMR